MRMGPVTAAQQHHHPASHVVGSSCRRKAGFSLPKPLAIAATQILRQCSVAALLRILHCQLVCRTAVAVAVAHSRRRPPCLQCTLWWVCSGSGP